VSAVLSLVAARLLSIAPPVASGLFCGSLTNTPALAAAVEALRAKLQGSSLAPEQLRLLLDGPTIGYSVSYPFGVAGLILMIQIVSRRAKTGPSPDGRVDSDGSEGRISRAVRFGSSTRSSSEGDSERPALTDLTGMVFTRIKRGERIDLVDPEVRLQAGDVLVGVGSRDAVRKAEILIGPLVEESVERLSPGIEYRDLLILNRKIVGIGVSELSSSVEHPVIVSRIRRGESRSPHSPRPRSSSVTRSAS